jgi:hypothetical protein
MTIFAWILTAVLLLVGLAGVVLPLLPGTTLILIGVVLHKLLLPASLSWGTVGGIAALCLLSVAFDMAGVLIGTRLGGGSKWAMMGAGGGAFLGAFISIPALLLGTMLGAILAERLAHERRLRDLLLAGMGAGAGFLLGFVGRLACAVAMITVFLVAALHR